MLDYPCRRQQRTGCSAAWRHWCYRCPVLLLWYSAGGWPEKTAAETPPRILREPKSPLDWSPGQPPELLYETGHFNLRHLVKAGRQAFISRSGVCCAPSAGRSSAQNSQARQCFRCWSHIENFGCRLRTTPWQDATMKLPEKMCRDVCRQSMSRDAASLLPASIRQQMAKIL